MNYKMADLYNKWSSLKIIILVISLLIAGLSILYTQQLVNKLAARERNQMDLFAKGMKVIADPNNDGSISFLFQEIIETNNSIPVILTDEREMPISDRNISFPKNITDGEKLVFLINEIQDMKAEHAPILVEPSPGLKNYIFYKNSYLLRQLIYYPYIQLTIIAIFAIITFVAYSYSKNSEQNRVWVGLAKETAHQLGTPLSSLMAWVELFKADEELKDKEFVNEIEKDINRLEMVTSRFSNIGSVPALTGESIFDVINNTLNYLRTRTSPKIKLSIVNHLLKNERVNINIPLFDWVIENLCKNAIDAMDGIGSIEIHLNLIKEDKVAIDISDTGKGIPKNQISEIFKPGFSTKKRGWGLGLTLVKRIVENYHKGKIFVKSSEIAKGTTFRIILNRSEIV